MLIQAIAITDPLAGVTASVPANQRWTLPPVPGAALAPQPMPASLLDERTTPLRTINGGRIQSVGPQSLEPVLKVTPSGTVLLDAGASVRYSDTHRPGIRIELSAPGGADVNVGRKDASGAVINPYAALVRTAVKPNATMVVVENGRVFLRRAEAPVLAKTLDPVDEMALKPSAGLPVTRIQSAPTARLQATGERNDVQPLDAAAPDAALDLKMESQIVDPFFSGENWIDVTEHATAPDGATVDPVALPGPALLEAPGGLPGNDAPLVSRERESMLAPERREMLPRADSAIDMTRNADRSEISADAPVEVSETALPYEAEVALLAKSVPTAAAQATTPSWQAVQVHAPDTMVAAAAERATLVILPAAIRPPVTRIEPAASTATMPRPQMTRLVIDLFDDPEEIESLPVDTHANAKAITIAKPIRIAKPITIAEAMPVAKATIVHGEIAVHSRPDAIARKTLLFARTRRD